MTDTLLPSLISYVPNLIARSLAADPRPLTEPTAERFPAAVLFADISGFTPLTEQLAQKGPVGAEELTRILNDYFGQLIEIITHHGGDVVKFAGDALIALWPVQKEEGRSKQEEGGRRDDGSSSFLLPASLSEVTLRSAQCALAVQATLHNYPAAEGKRLSLRIGIGAGDVLTASVGGQRRRWELLVAGNPLIQMGLAKAHIQPGEVALSSEAWAYVAEQCLGEPSADGVRLLQVKANLEPRSLTFPAPMAEAEAALRSYIPGALLARVDAGQTEWLAELRRITIVFVKIIGLNYDGPDALPQTQAVMYALQNVLYQYEGSVNQFMVDDKGTIMVMAFGLPPLAHEDDPLRGLQAALAMRAELASLGKQSAIGLATGRVFCGALGSARRRQYAILGDPVNLSARLMEAAPDDILCDAVTYQAAQSRFEFQSLPPLKVKGKAEPVAIYRPHAAQGQVQNPKHHSHLVGRTAERNRLAQGLQTVSQGMNQVIMIEGEAGIGKSRLVEDFWQQARALEITACSGAADPIEKAVPYRAWRSVFRQVLNLEKQAESAEAGLRQVTAPLTEAQQADVLAQLNTINPELVELAPLLEIVLLLDLPDNELTEQMTGQVRADNTRDLFLHILQASAQTNPLVIVIEDAHWLDSASWALLELVSREVHPALLVLTTRPISDPLPTDYVRLLNSSKTQQIRLEALPAEDIEQLVCHHLGAMSMAPTVAQFIRGKAEGHPFFSEELAYALQEAGLIQIANGQCQLAPGARDLQALNLPNTIEGVITSRIDRLQPQQQLTLKVASVIGRVFAFHTLHDIHPIEADKQRLHDYLNVLARLDITPLETPEPELSHIFKHVITQEVAYNLMAFAQRRQLHQIAAHWYETTYAEDLAPFYALLAHHWTQAEVPEKAVDYLEKAGTQALANYANVEAIRFFSEAIRLEAGIQHEDESADQREAARLRRADWHTRLGTAYHGLGNLPECRAQCLKALELLGQPMPRTTGKLVLGLLTELVRQIIHRLWPQRFVPQQAAPNQEALLTRTRPYLSLATIYYLANETLPTLYVVLRNLNLTEKAGPSPELAETYANMCVAVGLVPVHPWAEAYGRWGEAMAHQFEHLPTLVSVLIRISLYKVGVGQWANVHAKLEQAREICERLGDHRQWGETLGVAHVQLLWSGDIASWYEMSNVLVTEARHRNNPLYLVWGLQGLALHALHQGRATKSVTLLEEALAQLAQNADRLAEVSSHSYLALAHLRLDQRPAARAAADEVMRRLGDSSPTDPSMLDGYACLAEVYTQLWAASAASTDEPEQRAELGRLAQRVCRHFHKLGNLFPVGLPQAWLWQGEWDWLQGQPEKARRAWQKSLEAAERLAMPYDEGLAHYALGSHLPVTDSQRQSHLTRAAELFTRLEDTYDLERVKSLLAGPTSPEPRS